MNEEQKQEEIKKIISICEENGIEHDLSKLDFTENDTGKAVNLNEYSLLVIREGNKLKLDGFYSFIRLNRYLQQAQADNEMNGIYEDKKEMVGYIIVDKFTKVYAYSAFNSGAEEPPVKQAKLK